MSLENSQLYDPTTNTVLAQLLSNANFDYTGIEPREFTNPETKEITAAVLARSKNDIVLVIAPGKGTSVMYHKKETGETLTFLGPVVRGTEDSFLAHKYQADALVDRNRKSDVIKKYVSGFTFITFPIGDGEGRWRGYHNLDPNRPVAVLIEKVFE